MAIRPAFAKNLAEVVQSKYEWFDCTLSCRLCVCYSLGLSYVAIIDRIDIYNAGGEFVVALTDPGDESNDLYRVPFTTTIEQGAKNGETYGWRVVSQVFAKMFEGSPSVKKGDKLISVFADDGNEIELKNEFTVDNRKATALFFGPKDSSVRIKILSQGEPEPKEVEVKRTLQQLRSME